MDKLLLTPAECADALNIGRSKLYEYLDKPGGLPTVRFGRAVRIPAAAVERWVAERTQDAKEATPWEA